MNRILIALVEQSRHQEANEEFNLAVLNQQYRGGVSVPWKTMFQFPMDMVPGLRAQPFWDKPAKIFEAAKRLQTHSELIQQDFLRLPETAWKLQNDGDLVSQ